MAGVIGSSGGGYATINPTQGNPIANAMQAVENSAFQYNAHKMANQRAQQEAEQSQREERIKKIQASDNYKKENPFVATGITDVDSQRRASYENAISARNEAINNFTNTGDKKYQAVIARIDSGVNEMKTEGDAWNNHVKSITDGVADGTYNANSAKNKAALIDETFGKIVRKFDSEGNSRFDVLKNDDDGVITVLKSGLTTKQLIDYNTPVKAFHIDGLNTPPGYKGKTLVDDYNLKLGKPHEEFIGQGENRKKKIYYPDAPKVAKTMSEVAVKSKDNLYEIFSRMGIDPEDESNYQNDQLVDSARQYLEKTLLDTSTETISPNPDTSFETLQESKRQHNQNQINTEKEYNRNIRKDQQAIIDKEIEKNTTKVSHEISTLNDVGKKFKKQWLLKNNAEDWYDDLASDVGGVEKIITTKSVVKNERPNNQSGVKQTKAELKAKADALRKKYAPK